jgi:hypothetical protein
MEGSKAWWPLEGSKAWWPIGMWRINTFSPLPFSPNNFTYTLNFSLWLHDFTLPWS